jgi:hypothetical protein
MAKAPSRRNGRRRDVTVAVKPQAREIGHEERAFQQRGISHVKHQLIEDLALSGEVIEHLQDGLVEHCHVLSIIVASNSDKRERHRPRLPSARVLVSNLWQRRRRPLCRLSGRTRWRSLGGRIQIDRERGSRASVYCA